jgi:uncharacterized membrane protein YfcA
VGGAAGFLTGLFGIGGAAMSIPTLVLVFGLTQTAAQGLALALSLPGMMVALATYGVAHDVDWAGGIALALGGASLVGSGVALAHRLPERTLKIAFCCMLYAIGTTLWLRG